MQCCGKEVWDGFNQHERERERERVNNTRLSLADPFLDITVHSTKKNGMRAI